MKTFGFTNNAGWIGGSGVVICEDKETAINLINESGETIPFKFVVDPEEVYEIEPNKVFILTTGDY